MVFGLNSIRRWAVAAVICAAVLLGATASTSAQHRRNGPPYGRAYGYYSRQQRHEYRDNRRILRRNLRLHQQDEREAFRNRIRQQRSLDGNNGDWRNQRHAERIALRSHQRAEREDLRETIRNNRRRPH